ncbi:hypothetical protein BHE74_00038464, partial [Ensete ventricosum]
DHCRAPPSSIICVSCLRFSPAFDRWPAEWRISTEGVEHLVGSRSSMEGGHERKRRHDEEISESFNLRNLSKLVLPPLGVSTYNQNQNDPRGKVILPMDSRYRCWETFMVVLVAYSAWVYPFEIAFMGAAPKGGLFIADNVIDAFFAVDIVLTFFVAYIDSRTQVLVRDPRKIAVR